MMTNVDFPVVRGEKKGRNVSGNQGFFGAKSQESQIIKNFAMLIKKALLLTGAQQWLNAGEIENLLPYCCY